MKEKPMDARQKMNLWTTALVGAVLAVLAVLRMKGSL